MAKPGSGLATLTQGFTYESAFNKVATSTDARGKATSYTYTAQGLPLAVTSSADAADYLWWKMVFRLKVDCK